MRQTSGVWLAAMVALSAACGGRTSLGTVTQQAVDSSVAKDAAVPQAHADKVDLLLAIDNSRSMTDKQALLADSIPALVQALISPRCVSTTDPTVSEPRKPDGTCPSGTRSERPPVTDLHIGVVSSSLGGGGAEQTGGQPTCPANATEPIFGKYSAHNDDRGHLIARQRPTAANGSGVEAPVTDALPLDGTGGDFLAWLPNGPGSGSTPNVTPLSDLTATTADFVQLVNGVGGYGCGLEAQLESWYRFLVQPDPYDSIAINPDPNGGPAKATLVGIDATLLKQRHDFLRPDSAVIIVQLTDEEDSWSDPLALGGRGWVTRSNAFPGSPTNLMPLATSACDAPIDPSKPATTGPNDPNCTSCGFAGNLANGTPIAGDPKCQTACGPSCVGFNGPKSDGINIRYTDDVKRRYGFDFQFPIQRYVDGLTSTKVPDRDGEHPGGTGPYKGNKTCTNPLFAASISPDPAADACHAALGPRTPDLVFYVHIGGVPWQLLADTKGVDKPSLGASDWQAIVGRDPDHHDYTGIDPHMIESYVPRVSANAAQIPYLGSASLPGVTAADTADPLSGREWNTYESPINIDLEFACVFELPTPKECTDPANAAGCDCVKNATAPDGPPLCADGVAKRSLQVRGKAYPTIRELRLAKALGNQAVVGSICARSVDPKSPSYGYLPAIHQLLTRIGPALAL